MFSVSAWRPELVLCLGIVLLLLAKMVFPRSRYLPFGITLVLTGLAFFWVAPWGEAWKLAGPESVPIFDGVLGWDAFGMFFRMLILGFTVLFVIFLWLTGFPHPSQATDFLVMYLGAVVGMCVMVSADHLLLAFLGMEMASLPSYILAGFHRKSRQSGEAAMKFAVFGAASAGIMLYGISLLGGVLGTFFIPGMAERLIVMAQGGDYGGQAVILILGSLMVLVGLAFKLSAVPFHFWLPDVFEGAAAEVGTFLSVVSKAAALGLLTRLSLGLLGNGTMQTTNAGILPIVTFLATTLSVMAAVTCTYGNWAAYGQKNIKRLLGYSTIAHAGYMMMPIAAAVAVVFRDPALARWAVATLLFYLVVYLFMNFAAFATVALLRDRVHSEMIDDFAGLVRTSPGLVVCVSLALFSLVGLPPLAGFAGKFAIFSALVFSQLWALFVIAAVNTVLSLFYYVRVVKIMVLDVPRRDSLPPLYLTSPGGLFLVVLTIPIVILGVFWQPVLTLACRAVGYP
ncbi:MAG: NADH-quinone oxidoreductase subunit N [Thermogutta sp.]